ncbi:MAG TPA: ATP-binding protein [Gemmatimonadaceae bacterium]|jgi:PAS domain S-box-containing protein|nr:ATP-binding protein [Gemmatimonadaceae bacterium]
MNDPEECAAAEGETAPQGDARDLWRAVNELIEDTVLQARPDGTIFFISRPPRGTTSSELVGRNVLDLVSPAMREEVWRCLREMAPGNPALRRMLQAELPNGARRWYATTTVPVSREGRVVALTIAARDVALQRASGPPRESRVVDALQSMQHAQKLELIGLLAGGLVHNFNNVLTVIGSASDMLLDALSESDPLRSDVESIQRAIRHGSTLTKQLLALSRRQAVERSRIELNTVVQEVATMSRLFLDDSIKLVINLDPSGAAAHVDRSEMEQVLLNLLLNARDAMPNGGSILIATTRLTYTAATAPRACKLRGPVVRIRVQDNGVGIDEDTRGRVFEPFFSTKPLDRGTGLGLATVEAIVKASAGCVDLTSRPGVGTTVDIVLPEAESVGLAAAA